MKNLKIILPSVILAFIVLAAIYSCSEDKRSGDTLPEMKMPFAALNIALKTQILITNDREYLEELEKESAMSRKQIRRLIKYLLKNQTIDEIKKNAGDELGRSLKELQDLPDDKKVNFFVINILAPYLTMTVNNIAVNSTDEKEILSVFAEIFNVSQDKINPLLQLTESSSSFHNGGVFKSIHLYELNDYLKKEGFCLDYGLRGEYANIFKIENVICKDKEWKPDEKISIFVLRRIYPNILSGRLGYAPAEHSDVFIIKEPHYHLAKKYKSELKKKMPQTPYSDLEYEKMLGSIGLSIDLERANRIRYELAYKDLKGSSLSRIEKNLILQTAFHEAKHRIDEIDMPDMRLNLDMEVSAYLTTAIFGNYPFLGLRQTIEWTGAYYHSVRSAKLGNVLKEIWTLADKSLKEEYTEELLRAELLKIYENYRTIRGNAHLINLEEFKQRMAPVILKN